jgi:hypothetical protein
MYAYMLLITNITRNPAPHVVLRQRLKEGHSNVIDAGILHALGLSPGAFSCRTPFVLKQWDSGGDEKNEEKVLSIFARGTGVLRGSKARPII